MYLSFYNLTTKPFPEKTDPARIWLNKKTKEALASFRDGIEVNRGILLLTGDVGTGKTSFINRLTSSFSGNIVVGNVVNPGLDRQGLLQVLADIFHLNKKGDDPEELLPLFKDFLIAAAGAGKKVLLIIDEAQRLSDDVLKFIQLLTNLASEDNGSKLLSIILVGQNDINTVLFRPENIELRQEIAVTYNIIPLTKAETEQYIKHHLQLAGGSEDIFSPEAMDAVFNFTEGSPRLINLICDLALLNGFTSESPVISREIVSDCTKKLMLPHDKTTKLPPIAVHKTAEIGKQPFSRQKKTGWRKPSFGLSILIVLILFGARLLFNKMEMEDGSGTTGTLQTNNETIAFPKAEIPPPAQTLRELATSRQDEPAAENHIMEQPAAEEKHTEVAARDSAAHEPEAIQIAAIEDTPPVIHDEPLETVKPKAEIPPSLQTLRKLVTSQLSEPAAEQPLMEPPATAEPPAKVTGDRAEPTAKAIQIIVTEDTPPVHDIPPENAKPKAAQPFENSDVSDRGSKAKTIQIAAVTDSKDNEKKLVADAPPDSPVLEQEKPLPEKKKTPPEIITPSDLRNGSKKVITVFFGNFRDGPSIEAKIIGVVKQGDIVINLREKGNWRFVKLVDGRLGWMHQSLFAIPKIAIKEVEEPAAPSATSKPASKPVPKSRVTVRPLAVKKAQPKKEKTPGPSMAEASPPRTPRTPGPSAPSVPPATEKPIKKTNNQEALEWTQKSFESVSKGRFKLAIDEASKAIGLNPNLANPYINRAWAYSETGLYEQAIADCYAALAIEPKNALAFNNLGLAFHRMEQLATAREYYKKACDLNLNVACNNYKLLLSVQ